VEVSEKYHDSAILNHGKEPPIHIRSEVVPPVVSISTLRRGEISLVLSGIKPWRFSV
jgi:hypothetical protein